MKTLSVVYTVHIPCDFKVITNYKSEWIVSHEHEELAICTPAHWCARTGVPTERNTTDHFLYTYLFVIVF